MPAPLGLPRRKIAKESEFGLVLMTENLDVMKAGVEASAFKKPLLYAATADNADDMGALGKRKRAAPGGKG